MISLAIAGKPNCGKSTFFKASTMAQAEIANYPFTTIDANHGVGYVRAVCPCRELRIRCESCRDGARFVPVGIIDVAGLVPDAHLGRGLGNQFLDHLREAHGIIHVVDASGGTDSEGNPVPAGSHDPTEDIRFLQREMTMWLHGIIGRHWPKLQRQAQSSGFSMNRALADALAGLGIRIEHVKEAERAFEQPLHRLEGEELVRFAGRLLTLSKPMLTVANKVDAAPKGFVEALAKGGAVCASAAAELALRNAAANGIVKYLPGDRDFSIVKPEVLNEAQKAGLAKISALMKEYGGTGVQTAINRAVLEMLDMVVVYPVEDEHKYSDKDGRVLPDAFLMKRGSTPRDLAYQVHTEIGEGFLYAVDARTHMRVKDTYVLKTGDIIKIASTAR